MGESAAKDAPPRILGRYALYDAIAAGGMATVHYGRLLGPVGFSRTVAIKRLHPQYAQDPEFVTMFLDEARMAARIRHPNVVATIDVVATDDEILLVMDYVHGETLGQILREVHRRGERVPPPIALRIASDALQGLDAAHEATDERGAPLHLVHRDISPQNILVGSDGAARLVDFGVAKAAGRASATREGDIKGKLSYMSPEQLQGLPVTRQADIHAFAIVLWEMLSGQRLFVGNTETELVRAVMMHTVPSLAGVVRGLSPELDAVVRKGVAVKLDKRFASARDMLLALETCGPMAGTMAVADWVQAQMKERLDQRSKVIGAIERDQGSAAGESWRESSSAAAKAWVKKLSSPDLSEAAAASAAIVAAASPAPRPEPKTMASDAGTPGPVAIPVRAGARDATPEPRGSPLSAIAERPHPLRPVMISPPEVMGLPRASSRALVWSAAIACAVLAVGIVQTFRAGDAAPREAAALPAIASVAPSAPAPPIVDSPPIKAVPAESPAPVDATPAPRAVTSARSTPAQNPPRPPPRKQTPSCDPPFIIDAMGVRVPKRECFQ